MSSLENSSKSGKSAFFLQKIAKKKARKYKIEKIYKLKSNRVSANLCYLSDKRKKEKVWEESWGRDKSAKKQSDRKVKRTKKSFFVKNRANS